MRHLIVVSLVMFITACGTYKSTSDVYKSTAPFETRTELRADKSLASTQELNQGRVGPLASAHVETPQPTLAQLASKIDQLQATVNGLNAFVEIQRKDRQDAIDSGKGFTACQDKYFKEGMWDKDDDRYEAFKPWRDALNKCQDDVRAKYPEVD